MTIEERLDALRVDVAWALDLWADGDMVKARSVLTKAFHRDLAAILPRSMRNSMPATLLLWRTDRMSEVCKACEERPVDHPSTGECHRCLQRRWRQTNPQHNLRVGKRADQKRAADRARAERLRMERASAPLGQEQS